MEIDSEKGKDCGENDRTSVAGISLLSCARDSRSDFDIFLLPFRISLPVKNIRYIETRFGP